MIPLLNACMYLSNWMFLELGRGEGLRGSTVLPNVLHPLYLFIVKRSLSIVSAHSTASSLEAHVTQGPVNSVLVLVSLMQSVFPVLLPLSLCSRERHLKYWGKQP